MSSPTLTRPFLVDYGRVLDYLHHQIATHNPAAAGHAHTYAALLLEHLLFLTFLQQIGWLDGDSRYLQHRFAAVFDPARPDRATFYPQVLVPILQEFTTDLVIPDGAFQPFFDELLNRYLFSIREAAPGDAELAIDPSVLGAIFESLTLSGGPDGGRRTTGSYYTPRAIVHFTCQQALQAYIKSASQSARDLLLGARIVDPAAGTGAFLVGMLHEIAALVRRLDQEAYGPEYVTSQPDYDFEVKRQILDNCLFGVDIQLEAVHICRWRLWLSLLADYPYRRDCPAPQLPDLTRHIVHGDGLADPIFWRTQFPQVFDTKDGFDLCIGNPPYSARLPTDQRRELGKLYPTSAGQKNSAIMFMELASSLAPEGHVALVVPKSLTYSRGWSAIRRHISAHGRLVDIVDVSEAFAGVRLEQVIVVYRGLDAPSHSDTYACYHLANGDLTFCQASPTGLIEELDGLPIHISPAFYDIYRQIKEGSILLGAIAEIFRGLPWQARLLSAAADYAVPIRRGKQVRRYSLLPPADYVALTGPEAGLNKVQWLRQPKIVSQNIVAHVHWPHDRIVVMAALDEESMLNLDTVENVVLRDACREQFSLKYLLAVLNSSLAAWFYYYLVYNRAVRTMHFDAYYAGKLPLKPLDSRRQAELASLVDELIAEVRRAPGSRLTPRGAEIYRVLDDTLFDVYDLTNQQRQLILDATGMG